MDAAAPEAGGLAGIVGLRRPTLEPILEQHALFIAIVNDVDSFVVGGYRAGLEAACQRRRAGSKARGHPPGRRAVAHASPRRGDGAVSRHPA